MESLIVPPDLSGLATGQEVDDLAADLAAFQTAQIMEAVHVVGAAGEPAFQNSWTSFAGLGPVGFWKDPHGMVYLQGVPQCTADPAANSVLFVLPVGYRPALSRVFTSFHNALGNIFVTIEADGDVICTTNVGLNAAIYLDGILFRAA